MLTRGNFKRSGAVLIFIICLLGIMGNSERGWTGQLCNMHQSGLRGPHLDCTDCHNDPYPGYLKDSLGLASTSVCNPCHSPEGQFDGVGDPVIGAKANWLAGGVYEGDKLKPGKEKWCVGCHDDGTCTIQGLAAPNIAGKSMPSGDWKSPALIATSDIQGAANLLDHLLDTGNISPGTYVTFDLAQTIDVSHIRLFTAPGSEYNWNVYGGNDPSCSTRILLGSSVLFAAPTWKTGPQGGWNEIRLDRFIPVRYIKLVKLAGPLGNNVIREFEYKKDLQYGYYTTGHKIGCDRCHNLASTHINGDINGVAQTYKASLNNYQSGYRLNSVQVSGVTVPPLEIPRVGLNGGETPRTSNDFALCFTCHDKYNLLGDAYGSGNFLKYPLATNFRNDRIPDGNGKVINSHFDHLNGNGPAGTTDWDSDLDGTVDSPESCPACHNVHGSPNPAMTRHGELTSTPGTVNKVPMINLQYLNANEKADPDLWDVMDSTGAQTQFYGPGRGSITKNYTCNPCHNDQVIYYRTPVATCQNCHEQEVQTQPSHHTHLQAARGPAIGCWNCHAAGNADSPHTFIFADNKPLAETTVCDPCHSPKGSYNGVSDPVIGAKNNWNNGVYQGSRLKAGKEKWCAGCHDEIPAKSKADGSGVDAPSVIGKEIGDTTVIDNKIVTIPPPYGYYKTGHGKLNLVFCTDCHDPSLMHIDHKHRTYKAVSKNYQEGYRLKVINGKPALKIKNTPPIIPDPTKAWEDFALCFTCHNKYELLGHSAGQDLWHKDPPYGTNFGTCKNDHYMHLALNVKNYCDSDFDGTGDSASTCTTCHNVHGSPSSAMIRHGELISPVGTQNGTQSYVPAFDFAWMTGDGSGSCTFKPTIPTAGQYKVLVTWPDIKAIDPSLNSSHAKYKVAHANGESIFYKNQRENAGKSLIVWNTLGTFYFDQGTSGSVTLTSEDILDTVSNLESPPRDALSYVIADAVQFQPVADGSTITVDNLQAEFKGDQPWLTGTISTHNGPDFQYYRKSKRNEKATRMESVGGDMNRPNNMIGKEGNHVCVGCHGKLFYAHPSILAKTSSAPAISSAQANPQAVHRSQSTLITAYTFDTDNNLAAVAIDLSTLSGSPSQIMYDDGTHGDLIANDHTYSVTVYIQPSAAYGIYQLKLTAKDATDKQDQMAVSVEVIQ